MGTGGASDERIDRYSTRGEPRGRQSRALALPAIWAHAQKDARASGGFGADFVGRLSAHFGGIPASRGRRICLTIWCSAWRRWGERSGGLYGTKGKAIRGTDADATSYAERFQQAVAAWREALADAELPVLTVQLNRVYQPADPDADRRWSQVREAQRQVARQTPGIGVVPALDLPLSDQIHISPAGNMLLGERLAQAALGLVYGQPVAWQAPDLAAARRREGPRRVGVYSRREPDGQHRCRGQQLPGRGCGWRGVGRGGELSPGPSRRVGLGAALARSG